MPFIFSKKNSRDKQRFGVSMTKQCADIMYEMADLLELDNPWPIIPLILEDYYNMLQVHKESGEEMCELALTNPKTKSGVIIRNLDKLKVDAKRMQLKGLQGGKDE